MLVTLAALLHQHDVTDIMDRYDASKEVQNGADHTRLYDDYDGRVHIVLGAKLYIVVLSVLM